MEVDLLRKYQEKETLDDFNVIVSGKPVITYKAIELPNKGNVNKISCIKEGRYLVTKRLSEEHGHCFLLHDVPGRDSVEIHSGNFAAGKKVDTKGCILVGDSFSDINHDGNLDVQNSVKTLEKLNKILPDEFYINIKTK